MFLRYAAGLAGRREQWISNVFGQSPGGAFFSPNGHYYETPYGADSLSAGQRAGVVGGSVLSSLGLASAVVTGVGLVSGAIKGAWRAALKKGKEAARSVLHRAPWGKGSGQLVDSVAHRILRGQAEGGGQRQVLLMVFDSDFPADDDSSFLLEDVEEAKTSKDVVKWLQQRLAAQVVLPPVEVFDGTFSGRHQPVVNTRSNLSVADFLRGLLLPHCRDEVERHPDLLSVFTLSVTEPLPRSSKTSPHFSITPVASSSSSWQPEERNVRLRLLSPSLPMREAVDLLNNYRGAHFVVSVGPSIEDSHSIGGPLRGAASPVQRHGNRRLWKAVAQHCLLFKKKPPLNMAAATISVRDGWMDGYVLRFKSLGVRDWGSAGWPFVSLSVSLSLCIYIYIYLCLSPSRSLSLCLPLPLCLCLSLPLALSLCLSLSLSLSLSPSRSLSLSVSPYLSLSVSLCLCLSLPISLSVSLSVSVSLSLSFSLSPSLSLLSRSGLSSSLRCWSLH